MELPKEYASRLERLNALRAQGIDPYPANVERSHTIADFLAKFDNLAKHTTSVNLVGRVRSLRPHGGSAFAHIEDGTGRVQLFIKKDGLGDTAFAALMDTLDVGDFIAASGAPYTTKRGEKSLQAAHAHIIAKTLLPLPEKWHGLSDVEMRYRKRYLDLIMNEHVRETFILRSRLIGKLRPFMDARNYLEVQTPILQPIYGGGFAKPFITHHHALGMDMYLRISNEMYLKRLIVGGFERVYEVSTDFRNEGIDHNHNPEFTIMEAMTAYENYFYGMQLIEELTAYLAQEALGTTEITYAGRKIELKAPWRRLTMVEAIQNVLKIDVLKMDVAALTAECKRQKIASENIKTRQKWGELVALLFEEQVEPTLIQPTFIYNFPTEITPLAKKCPNDPRFTESFEQYINGWEIGNNYTEINDPQDLQKRFIEERKREKGGFGEAHQTDEDYVEAIMHGLPPTVGIATSIDRLVMLFTGAHNIKEVILFPTLRPEK
ncbi:lysine--tRNA ligase [Candidatus Uhrbacteria bacterium]|nr:lysine--tRNA ligase [Candidatus Uhrbacteria bacterium]